MKQTIKRIAALVFAAALSIVPASVAQAAVMVTEPDTIDQPSAYDLVLFFGQSNMVGNAVGTDNPFADVDAAAASVQTGIDADLIQDTISATQVGGIDLPLGAAFEYQLTSDSLVPFIGSSRSGEFGVDENGVYIGVVYNEQDGRLR